MDKLKEWLEPLLESMGCRLYEIEWDTAMKPPVLRIAVDNTKGPMDLDKCTECSEAISELLDEKDYSDTEYMLEVCSPGAERALDSDAKIQENIDQYVQAKLKDPKEGLDKVIGYLREFKDGVIVIEYNQKGRKKKISLPLDNVRELKTAVKF